jgi:hypothetical protein
MIANVFNKVFNNFSQTSSSPNPSRQNRRANRHFSICEGIERLEGRLAPSGGSVPILITETVGNPVQTFGSQPPVTPRAPHSK